MSFFTDLFEGHFDNLGTDLSHTFSSLASHPDQLAETLGVAGLALGGIGLLGGLGELGAAGAVDAGALGAADAGVLGAADAGIGADLGVGLAADLGINDIGVTAAGLGLETAGGIGADLLPFEATAADLGSSDLIAGTFVDPASAAAGASSIAPDALAPTTSVPSVASSGGAGMLTAAQGGELQGATSATLASIGDVTGGWAPPTLTQQLGGVLSSPWTRLGLGLAPLAVAGIMGQPGLPSAGQQAQGYANQLATYGQQQLALGTSGQLTPAQSAVISKMQQDLTNSWRQALYNQGVQNPEQDGRWPQILAAIDTQVTAATQQMLQQTIDNGLRALGQGGQQLAAISAQQMQADQNFTNMLVNATKALGTTVAGGSSFRVVPA